MRGYMDMKRKKRCRSCRPYIEVALYPRSTVGEVGKIDEVGALRRVLRLDILDVVFPREHLPHRWVREPRRVLAVAVAVARPEAEDDVRGVG